MSADLSPWFEASTKPTRKGVYEFEGIFAPFHYFDGKGWRGAGFAPDSRTPKGWARVRRLDRRVGITYHERVRWRGLASDPSKPANPKHK